jgi:hypothetical protein
MCELQERVVGCCDLQQRLAGCFATRCASTWAHVHIDLQVTRSNWSHSARATKHEPGVPDANNSDSTCRYASRQAQRLDWRRVHRRECPCLAAAHAAGKPVPASLRLAARILWQAQAELASDWTSSLQHGCNVYKAVQELEAHWDRRPDESKVQLANIALFVGCALSACKSKKL